VTDDFARAAFREREARQIVKRRAFLLHLAIWAATNVFIFVVWVLTGGGFPWFLFVLFGWGIGIVAHGAAAYLMADPTDVVLAREQKRAQQGDGPNP
jgi:hypothetical protein